MKMMRIGFGEQGMMAFTIIISEPEDGVTPYFIKVFKSCAGDKAHFWDMMKAYKNNSRMVFTALDHPDRNGTMRHILAICHEEDDYVDPVVALAIQRQETGTIFLFSVKSNRCILGLALTGPSHTTEIDADRHACFFSRFVIFF